MSTTTAVKRQHKLWNPAGEYGRGLFYADIELVVTWPEDEMTHCQRHETLRASGEVPMGEYPSEFYIYEDGRIGQYELSRQECERVLELVPSLSAPSYWKA